MVFRTWELFSIFRDTTTANTFKFFNPVKFFLSNSVWIVDVSVWVRKCNNFSTKLKKFFCCIFCNVSWTRNNTSLTLEAIANFLEHFLCKVDKTVTSSFCTDQRTTECKTFTSQNSSVFITDSLVLTKEITDFASTNVFITCWNVCIWTNVAVQFSHEWLAEAHNFFVWFSMWIKVWTTFTTTHWECCKRVFKNLFEAQELQYRKVYFFREAESSFVRTNCTVVLYAETTVYMVVTVIIHPRYSELDNALWFNKAFKDCIWFKFWHLIYNWIKCCKNFFYSLKEFRFVWVFSFYFFPYTVYVSVFHKI